jgi:hypothetical protein
MTDARFDDLKKLPDIPAAKIMAQNNIVLQSKIDTPANASVAQVLVALDAKGALIDMLQLLAHALPVREATWWACLSARDIVSDKLTPSIKAAEAWVLHPSEDTRYQARDALDNVSNEDETVLCSMAASFADGTLGPGENEDYDAPPGAVGAAVFGMALLSHFDDGAQVDLRGQWLLARGLDIARGGNGQIGPPAIPSSSPTKVTQ